MLLAEDHLESDEVQLTALVSVFPFLYYCISVRIYKVQSSYHVSIAQIWHDARFETVYRRIELKKKINFDGII